MTEYETTVLVDGIGFPEGPRWRDGKLWFSDFGTSKVHTVGLDGVVSDVVEVRGVPSGLGWLPDGRLLVVSMEDRKLMRLEGADLVVHADLAPHAQFQCNDMVVDAAGRAYVGNFGYDYFGGAPPRPTVLLRADPDGSVSVAADDLMFPNGTVISADGKTLVVDESFGARMSAFDVAEDGSLQNRRVWASLEGRVPDGCCMDADGAVWVACPTTAEVIRVHDGGEVTDRVPTAGRGPLACMLGGGERRTLFVLTVSGTERVVGNGAILTAEVDVPGAGYP